MNILIDGRPFVAPSAGIANFLIGSLTAWARACPNDTFFVPLPKSIHKTIDIATMPANIVLKEYSNWLSRRLPNLIWICLMMPFFAHYWKVSIYYSPLPCLPFLLPHKTKKIIVVHDVVNLEFKDTMQWTNILSNRLFFNRSIQKADIIWTNSNYTKRKVEQYFLERRCQHIFIGCAIDRSIYHPLQLSNDEKLYIKKRIGIKGDFILFVGSLEPRKNLSFLLSLMPELYDSHQLQLVIVGGRGWKDSIINKIVNSDEYPKESTIFCGFITNTELAQLYNTASCFVSASLNEGFGMPQLEALLCGCPIVTSHNSAMTEVAANINGAITVEGYDRKKWIEAITFQSKQHPSINFSQLDKYDWNNILQRLQPILKESSR